MTELGLFNILNLHQLNSKNSINIMITVIYFKNMYITAFSFESVISDHQQEINFCPSGRPGPAPLNKVPSRTFWIILPTAKQTHDETSQKFWFEYFKF